MLFIFAIFPVNALEFKQTFYFLLKIPGWVHHEHVLKQ